MEQEKLQEKLNHIVEGVLNDFMAYLTCREEPITLSASHDAAPAVEVIDEFLAKRNVKRCDPLFQWPDRCTRSNQEQESPDQ
jgi:hypothetical protein